MPPLEALTRSPRSLVWGRTSCVFTRSLSNSELWSWSYAAGHYQPVPFGSAASNVDESDAAQLWSTAYLAVRPAVVAVGAAPGARVASR